MWLNFAGVFMLNKLILILIFNVCFLLCFSCRYRVEIPFDGERWRSESSLHINYPYRPGMARNLVSKKLLIGKTRNEIQEMLGEPEPPPEKIKNKFTYTLEEDYGWDIDPIFTEWLEITFTQENKVEQAEIKFQKSR